MPEHPDSETDPRIAQLEKLASELIIARVEEGIEAFREDGNLERALMFFWDAKSAGKLLKQMLEALQGEPPDED